MSNNHKKTTLLINFSHLLFAGVIIFEILNLLKAIDVKLEFTWISLIITAIATWTLLETIARIYKGTVEKYQHGPKSYLLL